MTYENQGAYLAHYGVIGMKWGRRRTPEQLRSIGTRKLASIDKKASRIRSKYL